MQATDFYKAFNDVITKQQEMKAMNIFANANSSFDITEEVQENQEEIQPTTIFSDLTNISIETSNTKDTSSDSSIHVSDLSPLENAFLNFMNQYDYAIINNNIIDTYKDAFPNDAADTKIEILKSFLELLGVNIDMEYIDDLLDVSKEALQKSILKYRQVTVSEILEINKVYDKPYFRHEILQNYSLEPRDTYLLIALMQKDKIDEVLLQKYAYNLDVLNCYLNLINTDKYVQSDFDAMLSDVDRLISYTQTVLQGTTDKFSCVVKHPRFTEIVSICNEMELSYRFLLDQYADFYYLPEILIAYSKQILSEVFIQKHLKEQSNINTFAAKLYADGKLQLKFVELFKGNLALSKLFSDIVSLGLSTSDLEIRISNNDYLTALNQVSIQLFNLLIKGKIDILNYKKYITFITVNPSSHFLKSFYETFEDNYIYFDYYFMKFLLKNKNLDIPKYITTKLIIAQESDDMPILVDALTYYKDFQILNSIIKDCKVEIEQNVTLIYLNDCTKCKELLPVADRIHTSFFNFVNLSHLNKYDYNNETKIFKSNILDISKTIPNSPQIEEILQEPLINYAIDDALFYSMQNYILAYKVLLNSPNSSVYRTILNMYLQPAYDDSRILYFILSILYATFPNHVKTDILNKNNVKRNSKLTVVGSELLNVTCEEFLARIDNILLLLQNYNSVTLTVSLNGNITLKGGR